MVQPLDMLKTRFQLSETRNPSVLDGLRKIVREEGFLRLYRGILPEMTGMIPKSSVMYATYDVVLNKLSERRKPSALTASAAGTASGYTEAITVTPFQVSVHIHFAQRSLISVLLVGH